MLSKLCYTICNYALGVMKLAVRIVRSTIKLCLFLAILYGFLLGLFIVADRGTSTLVGSIEYYVWMVLPLGGFGFIIGFVGIVIRSFKDRHAAVPTNKDLQL